MGIYIYVYEYICFLGPHVSFLRATRESIAARQVYCIVAAQSHAQHRGAAARLSPHAKHAISAAGRRHICRRFASNRVKARRRHRMGRRGLAFCLVLPPQHKRTIIAAELTSVNWPRRNHMLVAPARPYAYRRKPVVPRCGASASLSPQRNRT